MSCSDAIVVDGGKFSCGATIAVAGMWLVPSSTVVSAGRYINGAGDYIEYSAASVDGLTLPPLIVSSKGGNIAEILQAKKEGRQIIIDSEGGSIDYSAGGLTFPITANKVEAAEFTPRLKKKNTGLTLGSYKYRAR